jgi:WD40 repeat protein
MAAKSRRSALVVAVDEFQDPTLDPLRTPAADADALLQVLGDPEIGRFEVDVLLNEPESVVRRRLEQFFQDRRTDDLLLLHFACHGIKDQWNELYFAMRDTDVSHLESTAIPEPLVRRLMERSQSRRKVLLLDCCYSGLAAGSRAGGRVDVIDRYDDAVGVAVMTASSAIGLSFDDSERVGKLPTSVFTTALVDGLATGAADRDGDDWVTFEELYDHVNDFMVETTTRQRPEKRIAGRGGLRIAHRAPRRPGSGPSAVAPRDYSRLRQVLVLEGAEDEYEFYSVAFSNDGRTLLAGAEDKVLAWSGDDEVRRWDADALPQPEHLHEHEKYVYAVAVSPTPGRTIVASAGEDCVVQVTDLETGETWANGDEHTEAIYSLAFSADGALLASGGWDRSVILWNVANRSPQRRLKGLPGRVGAVAFAPQQTAEEERVLAIGCLDNTIKLWSLRTGKLGDLPREHPAHRSSVEALAFSSNGLLASCGLDKAVRVWDVKAGTLRWENDTEHDYLVRTLAFSPDGETLVSASWDKTVRLWTAATGEPAELPSRHTDWIWSVAFSPDGTMLATTGSDGQVIVWALPDG